MTTLTFLAEWALRSSILILCGGLLLWLARVKDPSPRLAAWAALLCGSMAMPLFFAEAPRIPVAISPVQVPALVDTAPPMPVRREFDWARLGVAVYGLVSIALLVRLGAGLALSRRLLRASRTTGEHTEGIAIRESDGVTAPVTMGLIRPIIVLPADWRQWSGEKRDAVLAHERSHIRRFDPAVQLLSAVHRALLWHSPMSWLLHNRIVRVAEEASDDAAITRIGDRALYAEVLLGFMRLGVRGASSAGVPMARYGRMEARINRILDGASVSRGLTRRGLAGILALALPLTYVVAAAHRAEAQAPAPEVASNYLRGMGSVEASETVVVAARFDGLLKSVGFREGMPVQQGQVLASLDSPSLNDELAEAKSRLERDTEQVGAARREGQPRAALLPLMMKVTEDQATVNNISLGGDIRSPIAGVAGFRMVDPGNRVHSGQPLVTVTQVQPAAVLFTIPEDELPRVRASLARGAGLAVEAWNRNNSIRVASGHLTAIDNRIDEQTGTVKLKALFDNKDGALFPGQFVNARLLFSGQ